MDGGPTTGVRGEYDARFRPVAEALGELLATTRGGAAVAVYHRGVRVVDVWGGQRDGEGAPWQRDTLSVSFSTTKGVVSTLLHVLADRGQLAYDDPVARHWPEFAAAGKAQVSVRELMSHRAGLYGLRRLARRSDDMLDWDAMCSRLAAAARQPPTDRSAYHALSYGWLAGELARRAGGRPLADQLAEDLAGPLELDGLYVGTPESELPRVATLLGDESDETRWDDRRRRRFARVNRVVRMLPGGFDLGRLADTTPEDFDALRLSTPPYLRATIPAINGAFTARSLARLYAVLAEGGRLDGVRLVSEQTLERATEQQTRGLDRVVPIPMGWRLGYHSAFVGGLRRASGFGHFGYGGSGAWASRRHRLAVALTCNSGRGSPFGDQRIGRIGAVALRCATG